MFLEIYLQLSFDCLLIAAFDLCSSDYAISELLVCQTVELVNRGTVLLLQVLIKDLDILSQELVDLSDNAFTWFAHFKYYMSYLWVSSLHCGGRGTVNTKDNTGKKEDGQL